MTAVLLTVGACASEPVRPPAKVEDLRQTRAPSREREQTPKLVAPPPAYGNKVVDGVPIVPPKREIARRTPSLGDG